MVWVGYRKFRWIGLAIPKIFRSNNLLQDQEGRLGGSAVMIAEFSSFTWNAGIVGISRRSSP
jgi:hypothetical protein